MYYNYVWIIIIKKHFDNLFLFFHFAIFSIQQQRIDGGRDLNSSHWNWPHRWWCWSWIEQTIRRTTTAVWLKAVGRCACRCRSGSCCRRCSAQAWLPSTQWAKIYKKVRNFRMSYCCFPRRLNSKGFLNFFRTVAASKEPAEGRNFFFNNNRV